MAGGWVVTGAAVLLVIAAYALVMVALATAGYVLEIREAVRTIARRQTAKAIRNDAAWLWQADDDDEGTPADAN